MKVIKCPIKQGDGFINPNLIKKGKNQKSQEKEQICICCGKTFLTINQSFVCDECSIVNFRKNREFIDRLMELKNKIIGRNYLTIKVCERCNLPYIVAKYYGYVKKYCEECKKETK